MSENNNEPKPSYRAGFRQGLGEARITSYGDAILRAAIMAIALNVAWFTPGAWYWKTLLFLAVMFVAGIVVPAVKQPRRNSK